MDPCVSCSQEFYIVTLTSCQNGCLFEIQNSSRNYWKGLGSGFEMQIFGETEHQQNNFGVICLVISPKGFLPLFGAELFRAANFRHFERKCQYFPQNSHHRIISQKNRF